jgi:NAD(P)-dependent dehydrogenase (short-subunit alcohol dehydrogenase family)
MTPPPLDGQVALVTGGSRGIGRAIALALAAAGADLIVAARTEPVPGTVEEAAEAVRALGRRALPLELDVGNPESVQATVRQGLKTFGRIDILVNNAGTNWARPFLEFPPNRWELVLRVNTTGPFLCSQAVLPAMLAQGRGHILNISSIAAVPTGGPDGSIAYSVSKAALDRLTLGLAGELQGRGVAVNALRVEGTVETEGTRLLLLTGRDRRGWWPPEIIGHAARHVVLQDPAAFHGRIVTIADLRPHVSEIDQILANLPARGDA